MTHPVVLLMRTLAPLPLPLLRGLGAALGHLLFWVARSRRHIALTNLALCFPDWSPAKRKRVARRTFVRFCQAALDRAWVWHGPEDVMRSRVRITGAVDDITRPGAVIVFAPHFYGLDAGGSGILQQLDPPACSIYSTQSNPAIDAWMRAGRTRFGHLTLLSRTEGVRGVVRTLRQGKGLYLLPDMDFGPEESIFVPFFGVPAATVPSVARFAKLGNARVVPVVTRMTRSGYEVQVHPAWQHYPTDDVVADTAYMNTQLEGYVRQAPEEYYWVHRRFKTRPPGVPPVY